MGIEFTKEKIKVVKIDEVRPNTWNPKDKDTKDYKKIKSGIELKGQRLPIIVRENKGFEIIDGEQRFTACKELGFKEVIIYDEGSISDQEAKELTIWYQQQVPFNQIELAGLVKEIVEAGDYELPFTEEEVKDFTEMTDFDWSEYENNLNQDLHEEVSKKEIECPECGHKFEV